MSVVKGRSPRTFSVQKEQPSPNWSAMKPIRRTPAPDLPFRRIATRYDKLTRNFLSLIRCLRFACDELRDT